MKVQNDFSSDYVLEKLGALMANPSRDNLYENSLGAINLAIKKIGELDEQIEKMKNPMNCEFGEYNGDFNVCYNINMIYEWDVNKSCLNCKEWRLKNE